MNGRCGGRLGAVAATVIDGEAGSRGAKNGPPARDLEKDRGEGATVGLRSSSGRFWGGRSRPQTKQTLSAVHDARDAEAT